MPSTNFYFIEIPNLFLVNVIQLYYASFVSFPPMDFLEQDRAHIIPNSINPISTYLLSMMNDLKLVNIKTIMNLGTQTELIKVLRSHS